MTEVEQITDGQGRLWAVLPAPAYIDGNGGQKLLDVSQGLLKKGLNRLALNLMDTRAANSVGISRLIMLLERVDERGGAVAFCAANPTIARTLRIMGLLQKAGLYSSVQEVAASSVDPG